MPLLVNGETVPDRVLESELLRISTGLESDAPHAGGADPEQVRSAALRGVIARTLLLQTATARKLRVSAADIQKEWSRRGDGMNSASCGSAAMASIADDLCVERIIREITGHVPRPSRAQAEAFYRRNQHRYHLPEAVRVAHIVRNIVSAEEEPAAHAALQLAQQELAKGKSFAQVANRYSDCKGVGGSLGWVTRGQTVQAFEDVVFNLQPNERSGIFRTVFGLHIAIALQQRRQGVQPFDEVRLEIANAMFAEQRRQVLAAAVAEMERSSDIRFTETAAHG